MGRNLSHYFDKHVVRSRTATEMVWAQPDSGDCLIRYTIVAERYLIVTGDLGDAVYEWSRPLSFEWLSGLSLSYFAEKCQASENGRGNRTWCAKACKERILSYAEGLEADDRNRVLELIKDTGDAIEHEYSWMAWADMELREFWPDLDGICDAGRVISVRCELHLLGLHMAIQQIEAAQKAAAVGQGGGAAC